jgi:hypothetical protein
MRPLQLAVALLVPRVDFWVIFFVFIYRLMALQGDELAKRDDKGLWSSRSPAMPYQTSVPRAGHMVNPCIKAHATASPKTLSRTAGFDRKAIRVCQEHERAPSVT